MLHTPFYDPTLSYEENYDRGPFGAFADEGVFADNGEPVFDFFGKKVYSPFGIPAGPILNSNYVKSAFDKGFDLVVYKTVRSDFYPCHPNPNVVGVEIDGDLTFEKVKQPVITTDGFREPLSITNSFGVPSKTPEVWQEDVKKALTYQRKGQALILSFMGTVKKDQTPAEFVEDFMTAGKLALETGAEIFEVNLSCPNIGNEGLVCYNKLATEQVCKGLRKVLGSKPFIVKTGYFESDAELEKIAEIVNEYADGIATINTIQAEVRDKNGNQALPGSPMRLRSGVCGASIKWAGLDMVNQLEALRQKNGYRYNIIGVGGVMNAGDYEEYIHAGADAVMSATGAMWNPYLAKEIKESIVSSP